MSLLVNGMAIDNQAGDARRSKAMKDALKQMEFETEPEAAPVKCILMVAGVVGYKLCDRNCDCDHCPFDSAIHECAPLSLNPIQEKPSQVARLKAKSEFEKQA
jgi:hypothetical protein